jgi:cell division protein FtsQ
VIGAEETTRVRYGNDEMRVESERRPKRARKAAAGAKATGPKKAGARLAKSKRDERQRRQQTIRRRRAGYLLMLFIALVLAGWGLQRLGRSDAFSLDKIEVTGTRHHTPERIEALAGLDAKGLTLLSINAGAIERRLERDPWIADAKVRRSFPHGLVISLKERNPAVIVDGGGDQLWVVSDDGTWLSKRSAEDTGLVLVRDVPKFSPQLGQRAVEPEVINAVKVVTSLSRELRSKVELVSAPSVDETALRTTDDIEIFVGQAVRMSEKDRLIREILRQQKGAVVYINVRVVNRPTWRGLE